MALVIGDIYRVTWFQQYLAQNVLNVQFYECTDAGVDADETYVGNIAFADWQTNILPLQSTGLTLRQVKVENVTDGIGIGFWTPSPVAGGVAGDGLPPYVTWSFQQTRGTKITRHGHKYVGGIPEASQANGVTVLSPAQLIDFTEVFVDDMTGPDVPPDDNNFTMRPVIVGRVESPPGSGNYALDLTRINSILGLVFRGVSTENLRKFGKGF